MFVVTKKQVFKSKTSGLWGQSFTEQKQALSGNQVEDFKLKEMKSWNMSEVYRRSRKTRLSCRSSVVVHLCVR